MLANLPRIRVDEVLSTFRHRERLLEALRRRSRGGHDAVMVHDLGAACSAEFQAVDLAGQFDELDAFARGADGFQMPERFAHPVHHAALLLQRLDVGAAWYEDGVEHRGAHAFEVMVWLHALSARFVFAVGVDRLPFGPDDEGECFGGLERGYDAVEGDGIVAIADNDGDAACGDGGLGGVEFGYAETFGFLTMVWSERLGRCWSAAHFCDGLGKAKVDFAKALCHAVVDDWVVAMVELES